jgi:hypothetical protein
MNDWRMEEVENQVRFREFNEWIRSSNDRMGNQQPLEEFICECSDRDCREPLLMRRQEYDSIRAQGAQFLMAVNHENPEIDRVLGQNDRFAVSEKLPGAGERRARATDPRG